jgi:uncharacterized membrane protein (UPF0127 family)
LKTVAKTKLIVNTTRGGALCVGELADGPLSRMRGLLGRSGLPAGEGLLLSPAPGIHTAFMRFSIDALFLDRELRVIGIVEKLRPWRIASKRSAWAVLELTAGECARQGVEIGDRLELRERRPSNHSSAHSLANRPHARRPTHARIEASVPSENGDRGLNGIPRLSPMRVVVMSADRHFRTTTSVLLARRNCSVTTTAHRTRLGELIAREAADVVVIDVNDVDAGEALATVRALVRPIGIVVVSDDAGVGPGGEPTLARWGPFGDLAAAVKMADPGRGDEVGSGR